MDLVLYSVNWAVSKVCIRPCFFFPLKLRLRKFLYLKILSFSPGITQRLDVA